RSWTRGRVAESGEPPGFRSAQEAQYRGEPDLVGVPRTCAQRLDRPQPHLPVGNPPTARGTYAQTYETARDLPPRESVLSQCCRSSCKDLQEARSAYHILILAHWAVFRRNTLMPTSANSRETVDRLM